MSQHRRSLRDEPVIYLEIIPLALQPRLAFSRVSQQIPCRRTLMQTPRTMLALFATALAAASAHAASIYVVNYSNQFGAVDVATGHFSPISTIDPAATGGGLLGLAAGPSGNLLSLDFDGNLDAINPGTGALSSIGSTGLGLNAFALGSFGNKIFATDYSNNIYRVNPTTGTAVLIGPTGIPPDHKYPFTVNPDGSTELCDESLTDVNGVLYATYDEFAVGSDGHTINPPGDPSNAPKLYRIDPSTGKATLVASTAGQITSTFSSDGMLYGFKGSLNAPHSFEDPAISIDAIDLSTGALTPVSELDNPGGGIPGAVASPTPEPSSLILLASGLLGCAASIRRTRNR